MHASLTYGFGISTSSASGGPKTRHYEKEKEQRPVVRHIQPRSGELRERASTVRERSPGKGPFTGELCVQAVVGMGCQGLLVRALWMASMAGMLPLGLSCDRVRRRRLRGISRIPSQPGLQLSDPRVRLLRLRDQRRHQRHQLLIGGRELLGWRHNADDRRSPSQDPSRHTVSDPLRPRSTHYTSAQLNWPREWTPGKVAKTMWPAVMLGGETSSNSPRTLRTGPAQ
jgi:hypothetical protein